MLGFGWIQRILQMNKRPVNYTGRLFKANTACGQWDGTSPFKLALICVWHGKMVDGRQIQIGGENFAADVGEAKRCQTRGVFVQIRQSTGFVCKQVNPACGLFGGIFGPNFPNQARLLGDVLRQRGEGLRHFCAKWAAAGEINLQYNHGLLSMRIMDGNSISACAAVFSSSARNEYVFILFKTAAA